MSLKNLNVCKKEKITFGLRSWRKPCPKVVKKYATVISGFLASTSIGTFFSNHQTIAYIMLVVQMFLEKVILPLWGSEDEIVITEKPCEEIGAACQVEPIIIHREDANIPPGDPKQII